MKKNLDHYQPLMKFYIDQIIYNIINENEMNYLISEIKGNRGLKSRNSNEIQNFIVDRFVKQKISGTPNLYWFGQETDILEIFAAISRSSFFSYQTSLYIHSLTEELSDDIYMVKERRPYESQSDNSLTQDSIDQSFNKAPRSATNKRIFKDHQISLISGQFQDNIGVTRCKQYFTADLERTLIDCVVRPFYAGGSKTVLKAFEAAKGKLDTKKLYDYYSKMNFIYPYHQAVGFYLENSGYEESHFEPFLNYEQEFDFYLDYDTKKRSYDEKWRVYYTA